MQLRMHNFVQPSTVSDWSHENLFPFFHIEEDDEYYEDYVDETENWEWSQFHSLVLGPCYMFEYKKNVTAAAPAELFIEYDVAQNIFVYWIFHDIFPQDESKLYQTSENVYT